MLYVLYVQYDPVSCCITILIKNVKYSRLRITFSVQCKVNELKSQLEKHVGDGDENLEVPRLSTGRHTINDRNKEHIRKIEKDQKENLEVSNTAITVLANISINIYYLLLLMLLLCL